MSRKLLFASALAVAAAYGCGSLSNRDPSIATVSGTLAGPAPDGARVALVWHAPDHSWVVTNEAPVVNGSFSFDLTTAPPDSLFFTPNESSAQPPDTTVNAPSTGTSTSSSSGSSGTGGATPTPSGGGSTSGGGAPQLRPMDVVSGGVSGPLSAAVAAFILYVDTNGNGKFDVNGEDATSPDQIVAGSHELMLVYLRDGSNLDLEKLRDKAGQLPSRGYSLVLTSQSRWVPLDEVDLKSDAASLVFPYDVCNVSSLAGGDASFTTAEPPMAVSGGSSGGSSGVGGTGGTGCDTNGYAYASGAVDPTMLPTSDHGPYPAKGDPNLKCGPDGRSFSYQSCPAKPTGLCAQWHYVACTDYGVGLGNAQATPPGWPCDAAPATSCGSTSSSSGSSGSSGGFDAGSADSGS